ncbi:MAG: diguanylate cyclase [Alphaproteobacteria bacterium]|nr:diguanylate cyclase [Alphaproteobacteria bacterium]
MTVSRVLIVDDNPMNLEILELAVPNDFEVLRAGNGHAALELAREQRIDAILLDVMMPDLDGFEVCRRLKADPKTRDIPVIFVTSLDDADGAVQGFGVGAGDYVTRPIRKEVLRARLLKQIASRRREEELLRRSTHDTLTDIGNRRRFDEYLDQQWRLAERADYWLGLIMLDVDQFKPFNDAYGHAAGDEALRAIALALAGALFRPTDLVTRYGGEEFAIILPDTDLEGSYHVAVRAIEAVRQRAIPHRCNSGIGVVTISAGVASLESAFAAPEALFKTADQALYRAKSAGGNKVVRCADPF